MRCLVCEREFITPTANRCPYCAFKLTIPVLSIEAQSFLADLLLIREQGINLDRIRGAVRDTYLSSDQDYRALQEIGMKPYIAQWYATAFSALQMRSLPIEWRRIETVFKLHLAESDKREFAARAVEAECPKCMQWGPTFTRKTSYSPHIFCECSNCGHSWHLVFERDYILPSFEDILTCPSCNSPRGKREGLQILGGKGSIEIKCEDCGMVWAEMFSVLTGRSF